VTDDDDTEKKEASVEPAPEVRPNKVGYGHPPVEHQFQPGNPGRPPGSRNKPKSMLEEIAAALEAEVTIDATGNSVTARKAIALKAVRDALVKEAKITQDMVKLVDKMEARSQRWKKENPLADDPLLDLLNETVRKGFKIED
jgi:hypothetical protein